MSTEAVDVVAQLGFEADIGRLRHEIDAWVAEADPEMRPLLQWQFQGRSKYFRPLTIFSCYHAIYQGPIPPALVRSACVLEMFHNVSLIVDDILDQSRYRRGVLTAHARFGMLPALMASGYIVADGYRMIQRDPHDIRLLTELLKRLGVAEPKTWEDMADARLAKHVGLADPSRSGSARAIYETILQAYGWDKGWRVLTLMAANSVDFYEGSSSLAKDVTLGEIGVGPVIDYYGRTQVAEAGGGRLGYVTPASLTVITPDPIAILKGAPNSETARMFVDFVLSDAGQKLWLVKAGSPGGPKQYSLMRMPILPKVYDECPRADWTVDANPFEFKGSFSFDSEKGSRRRAVVLDLMKSTLIQPQNELRDCWQAVRRVISPAQQSLPLPEGLVAQMVKPPITEQQCLDMSDVQWNQGDFRSRTVTDWVRFAIKKYSDVADAAGK